MARMFLSFSSALATATLIAFVLGATPAFAQTGNPPSTPAATAQQKYPEIVEAINLLFNKRDYKGCIDKLTEASRKYPELSSAHVLLYNILAQLNQVNAARNELEEAVRITPNDPEPYVILGNIALKERRLAEAKMDFDKASELLKAYTASADRKSAMETQTVSGMAVLAEYRKELKVAKALLLDLLKLAPNDLVAHQRLARVEFSDGDALGAYETLKKAKAIDKENAAKNKTREVFLTPEAIMAQYYAEFERKDSPNPEKWFKSALALAPKDLPTHQVVTIWALEKGKLDYAKQLADETLKIEADDAALPVPLYKGSNVGRMLRGLVALWQKDWAEAEKYFEKIILENPNDFVAKNNMALALVEQDDPTKKQRALAYAEGNYSINKNNADALSTLGWVYFKRNEFDQARLTFDQTIKAMNGNVLANPDTATYVAYVLYHLDQKWQAKDLLTNILTKDRPFFPMKPEAEKLLALVKDAVKPADATPTVPPPTGNH